MIRHCSLLRFIMRKQEFSGMLNDATLLLTGIAKWSVPLLVT